MEAKRNWNFMRMKLYFPVVKAGIYCVFAIVPVIFNSYVLRLIKETNYRIFFNFYYIILFITNSFRWASLLILCWKNAIIQFKSLCDRISYWKFAEHVSARFYWKISSVGFTPLCNRHGNPNFQTAWTPSLGVQFCKISNEVTIKSSWNGRRGVYIERSI